MFAAFLAAGMDAEALQEGLVDAVSDTVSLEEYMSIIHYNSVQNIGSVSGGGKVAGVQGPLGQ
jgi:hypothetical protein